MSSFLPNLKPGRGGHYPVPTMLQMETTECAAACLGMILAYFGRRESLETLRVRCGVSRDGSNAANMMRAAREYGLETSGFRCPREDLFDLPFPMVIFWNYNHFVVLEGIRKGTVCINDPNDGRCRISVQEFDENYSGACFCFQPGPQFQPGGAASPTLLRGLLSRLGHIKKPLSYAALATLGLALPGVAVPTLLKVFIDEVLIGQNGSWMMPLLFGLLLAAIIQGGLTWLQRPLLARLETKLAIVMTTRFFWYIATLPMLFFALRYVGDIADRVASNDEVARLLSGQLAVNIINLFTMVIYAAVMFSYDVSLTLIAMSMVAINLIVLQLAARARDNANRILLKEQGKVAGASINGLQIMETLKANGAEDDFFSRWAGIHANALGAQQRLGLVTALTNVVPPLLTALTIVAILGFGGLRILDGALSIGALVAFQSLTLSFSAPIVGLVNFGASLQLIQGDLARLDDVLKYEPDARAVQGISNPEPEVDAPAPRGFIELDRVTFGYNVADEPLIEELNLSIRPGQRVALVGGSGSGKSTVAKLVCGLLTPWSGEVRVDGEKLEQIPLHRFAEIVAHVDQEIVLFEASVRDNVSLWDRTIEERDIIQALRDAMIHDVVASRSLKYDTLVEENGRNFSGGQRQRLELARALARSPAILALDEATAALDPLTEMKIDDNLRRRGCTCLIVAHRLSTVRDADEIVVLEHGRIVQRGVHEQLIAEPGQYRDLVSLD